MLEFADGMLMSRKQFSRFLVLRSGQIDFLDLAPSFDDGLQFSNCPGWAYMLCICPSQDDGEHSVVVGEGDTLALE